MARISCEREFRVAYCAAFLRINLHTGAYVCRAGSRRDRNMLMFRLSRYCHRHCEHLSFKRCNPNRSATHVRRHNGRIRIYANKSLVGTIGAAHIVIANNAQQNNTNAPYNLAVSVHRQSQLHSYLYSPNSHREFSCLCRCK